MTIPQLFIPDKLITLHGSLPNLKPTRSRSATIADSFLQVSRVITPLPPSSLHSSRTFDDDSHLTISPELSPETELDPLPFATETITTVAHPAGSPSYKSAVQAMPLVQSRPNTPELDSSGSSAFSDTASSDTGEELLTDLNSSSLSRAIHVNPNIVE
jgi:hypothetical protein